MIFYILLYLFMPKRFTYFLTVALHHATEKTGQTSNCIARVLFSYSCRPFLLQTLSHVFNFMYTSSLTELIHEILALFKLPQVLPLTPVGPRFHLMGLFTSEKLNTCPSVCKTEDLGAKPRHTLPCYLLLACRTHKIVCFYLKTQ